MKSIYDKEQRILAEEYNRKKDRNNIIKSLLNIFFWIGFFVFSYEVKLYEISAEIVKNYELQLPLYLLLLFLIVYIYDTLLDYFFSYKLGKKYNLINQEVKGWIVDNLKSFFISIVLIYITVRIYLFLIGSYPDYWWLILTVLGSIFSVILTFLFPVVLLPMFYKLKPYPEGDLKDKIMQFIKKINLQVEEIYEINLSTKVNFSNAAVAGLGKTRKILLGDNLKKKYSDDEITAVLAHELGHHALGHIYKNIFIQPFMYLFLSYVVYKLWPNIINWQNYGSTQVIYSLPLLLVLVYILSWLISPLTLYLQRKQEREADRYALERIENPGALATALARLADESLSRLSLNWYKLIFKSSHPPIKKRVNRALEFQQNKEE
ncbi:MAG: M48 family metalloprotease [Halanaerobiales bacterium]